MTQNYTKWIWRCDLKDRENMQMTNAFLFADDWTDVFVQMDIDVMWRKWQNQFFSEVKKFIPCEEPNRRRYKQMLPPWWGKKGIRRLVRAENRLFD